MPIDRTNQGASASHTPGPWEWRNDPYPDGKPYCAITAGNGCYGNGPGFGFGITGIISEADAQLIAAAPELLAAAIAYEASLPAPRSQKGTDAWLALRAVIAKATGQ